MTAVVYPALAATPGADFVRVHTAHSRRITPVVAGVYGALLAAWGWVLVSAPLTPWLLAALVGSAGALGSTALVAAPTHARLGRDGPRPPLLRRLLRADAVRCAGALLTLAAVLGGELTRTG
ncbi:hypothetical protein [Kineococcus rhizosphaerae]|uniref:DUF1772 domain-containing protein n=1 Tax=Kineococcus rhizosphaerae TaxID=559628 RepID=A0A2T0R4Q6_9ACTN|nr:hypothetical protein [Kineococcus rhizosphaerae]PRY15343.1 hypothetical protein CLV37_105271 [Kineococcus rhizosphaerae]